MSSKISGRILGELEKEIMEVVWISSKPVAVKEVLDNLQNKRKIAYTTVMTIMVRLVDKGVLTRKLASSSYLYEPKLSQEKFIAQSVHNIFTSVISTFGREAAAHFIKEIQKLNPQKRKELLKILDKKD